MDYGKLIYAQKSRRYCGKSLITYKALYRVMYCLFFWNENAKQFGYIAGIPYTKEINFKSKSEMNKFIKDNNYLIDKIHETK